MRARFATLILAAAGVSLGGCAYGGSMGGLSVGTSYGTPYGYGHGAYGSPYGGYGYGAGYGYGSGYGYNPYYAGYNPYYRSPFYGSRYYGSPYLGWYDGFYYPGNGYYVYDRDNTRRRISDAERRRWLQGIADAAAARASAGQTTNGANAAPLQTKQRVVRRDSRTTNRFVERARARSETRRSERVRARSNSSSSLVEAVRRRAKSD